MKEIKEGMNIKEGKGRGYITFLDGYPKKCMTTCFECGAENYALAVDSGLCAWCRFDANKSNE